MVDLVPGAETAPLFFLCHDPPVVAYQAPDVGEFLHEVFARYEPPHASAIQDVREHAVTRIWRENPAEIDRASALAGDDDLRAFADALDERYSFADLCKPKVGSGFSWGRHGPRTELRRHGDARLFAYAPPEGRRRAPWRS